MPDHERVSVQSAALVFVKMAAPVDSSTGTCAFCHHDERAEEPHDDAHKPWCPWVTKVPRMLAALEAYEVLARAVATLTAAWMEGSTLNLKPYMVPVLVALDKAQDIADGSVDDA